MGKDTSPRRRWSFSLRTMFVVVTLLAIPLGWLTMEWRFVRARTKIKSRLEEQSSAAFWYWDELSRTKRIRPSISAVGWRPFLREWLFDDRLVNDILIAKESYDGEFSSIAALFPESVVGEGERMQTPAGAVYWLRTPKSSVYREKFPPAARP